MYGGLTLEHHQGKNDKSLAIANNVQFCCFLLLAVVAFFIAIEWHIQLSLVSAQVEVKQRALFNLTKKKLPGSTLCTTIKSKHLKDRSGPPVCDKKVCVTFLLIPAPLPVQSCYGKHLFTAQLVRIIN